MNIEKKREYREKKNSREERWGFGGGLGVRIGVKVALNNNC